MENNTITKDELQKRIDRFRKLVNSREYSFATPTTKTFDDLSDIEKCSFSDGVKFGNKQGWIQALEMFESLIK